MRASLPPHLQGVLEQIDRAFGPQPERSPLEKSTRACGAHKAALADMIARRRSMLRAYAMRRAIGHPVMLQHEFWNTAAYRADMLRHFRGYRAARAELRRLGA